MGTITQHSERQRERMVSEVPFSYAISLTIGHEYVYNFEILILIAESKP